MGRSEETITIGSMGAGRSGLTFEESADRVPGPPYAVAA
jgi:hypothetical protein